MTASEMRTDSVEKNRNAIQWSGFYSVAFTVQEPQPIYHFKLWRNESSPMFVVVKENSDILPKLKPGLVLNMTYYGSNANFLKKQIETRIGPITNAREGRFQGHCTIDLLPIEQPTLNH